MNNWIRVKDRLPTKDGLVLIHIETADPDKPLIQCAWYDPNGFGWSIVLKVWLKSITHWMKLPLPPKKKFIKRRK